MSKHGKVMRHEPCPKCGSRDNVARYEDHYASCFTPGCDWYEMPGRGKITAPVRTVKKGERAMIDCEYGPLPARGISEETCRKYSYGKAEVNDKRVHVANYFDAKGTLVGQKIRDEEKEFSWLGSAKEAQLFGQRCWGGGGKRLIITEGEIDCLSVSQVLGNKWPCVSIQNGAQSAMRCVTKESEWVESFEEIVLCFDNDEHGRRAAIECAESLTPGKVKIATLPLKDANEMLVAGRNQELVAAVLFNATVYRPDGVVNGNSTLDHVMNWNPQSDCAYPWAPMNVKSHGLRKGELVVHCAGTGVGKSTICREIFYDLGTRQKQKVGIIALEESLGRVALHLTGLAAGKPLHIATDVSPDDKKAAWLTSVGNGNFELYDHWGSIEGDNLIAKIRYMVKGCGCSWILLDHISIVVSGDSAVTDERRTVDQLMTKLRSTVEETGCGMHIISHLSRRQNGESHEEGAQVSLRDLRSSHSIAQLADLVFAYERDQQSETSSDQVTVRLLKNRYSGETGVSGHLKYVAETGRIVQAGPVVDEGDY